MKSLIIVWYLFHVTCCRKLHKYLLCSEIEWDYTTGEVQFSSISERKVPADAASDSYRKATFTEFADGTFADAIEKDINEPLGLLGPTITLQPLDTLSISVKSNLTNNRTCSFHLSGPYFEQLFSERAGNVERTEWIIREETLQQSNNKGQCRVWIYFSHTDGERDYHSGLFGPLKVCKPGISKDNDHVALYVTLLFTTIDENKSWYFEENKGRSCLINCSENLRFSEDNIKYTINGYTHGTLPHLPIPVGLHIKWYVVSSPQVRNILTLSLDGHRFIVDDYSWYSAEVYPGSCTVLTVLTQREGRWLLSTSDSRLTEAGMTAYLMITPNPQRPFASSKFLKIKPFAIAVTKRFNKTLNYSTNLFVLYKDITFTSVDKDAFYINSSTKRILVLTAGVGEVFKIVMKNMASQPRYVHVNGLGYDNRNNEFLHNSTALKPGEIDTFYWQLDDPGIGAVDPGCTSNTFVSHTIGMKDVAFGLIIVCQPHVLNNGLQFKTSRHLWFAVEKTSHQNVVTTSLCTGREVHLHVTYLKTSGRSDFIRINNYNLESGGRATMTLVASPLTSQTVSFENVHKGLMIITKESDYNGSSVIGKILFRKCFSNYTTNYTGNSAANSSDGLPRVSRVGGREKNVYLAIDVATSTSYDSKKFKITIFRRYTNRSFKHDYVDTSCEWCRTSNTNGVVGPTLRVLVGDRLNIHLRNRVHEKTFNIAINGRRAERITTGCNDTNEFRFCHTVTYVWNIDNTFLTSYLPCTTHIYESDYNETSGRIARLFGHLIVCSRFIRDMYFIPVALGEFVDGHGTLKDENTYGMMSMGNQTAIREDDTLTAFLPLANVTVYWSVINVGGRIIWMDVHAREINSDSVLQGTYILPVFPRKTLMVVTKPSLDEWLLIVCRESDGRYCGKIKMQ